MMCLLPLRPTPVGTTVGYIVDVSATSMSRLIHAELAEGKITRVDNPPHCIHSLLGAVRKDDSSIRPVILNLFRQIPPWGAMWPPVENHCIRHIADCRRPLGLSINTKMSDVCSTFSYRNLDNIL